MKLAQRLSAVAPSATLAMSAMARQMRAEGIDVISLAAGEPDFDTPDNIKAAAKSATDRGETKYTAVTGIAPLRSAIAETTAARYGCKLEPKQVIVGTGAKQVLYNAAMCLLEPGDEAIVISPFWLSYPDMVRLAGATPVFVATQEDTGFLPDPAAIERAITPRTRILFLNSPNNPTGSTYPRALLEQLAEIVRRHPHVMVITDDIYEAMVYDAPFVSIAQVAPDLLPRMLIVSGVSKTYAMTGWRIGHGIGPAALIDAMERIQGASTSGASSISQAAAVEALRGPQTSVTTMAEAFRRRRDRIVTGLRAIPGVAILPPGGAFYAFVNVSRFYGERVKGSQAMSEHLLRSAHIATVAGDAFGSDAHIRLSFACSDRDLDLGLARLAKGLSQAQG